MRKKTKSSKASNPAQQRKRRLHIKRGLLAAKIIIILSAFALAFILYMNINKISRDFYRLTANAGFIVKEVTVEGQSHTKSEEISKILKIKPGSAIFSLDLQDLKARLESIEWIKYVIVERILPNNIHVSVVERTPIALGQKDKKLYIIDDEGAIINEKNIKNHFHLPIIIGDGAEIYANSLIKMLKIDPDLFKHISSIIRISERRWNIRFDNGLEVKMPEGKMEQAWNKVIKLHKNKELFNDELVSLDLRVPNKIFVEKK
jgi:cell division protein FtsQ